MGKETNPDVDRYWPNHVESWKKSGLSQSAYCRQVGISNKKFHYHMQRLKKDESKPALRFIEAQVAAKAVVDQKQKPKLSMRLILPNGVEAILEEVTFDLVPQMLEMARGLPC